MADQSIVATQQSSSSEYDTTPSTTNSSSSPASCRQFNANAAFSPAVAAYTIECGVDLLARTG